MGGTRYPRGIITFDWATMTYTKQATELFRNRTWTSCALLKGEHGENLVAVAGGQSDGTEVWNSQDGTVQLVSDNFPPLTNSSICDSKLVPIKDGSELLLYGGCHGDITQDGIWKFSSSYSYTSWSEFGKMILAKNDHIVVPFSDVKCPK